MNSRQEQENMMLIDSHKKSIRMVILKDGEIDNLRYEHESLTTLKGNIYLAKISRIEPSLQAAFIDFGQTKQGFLPFTEIHPDYYLIPSEDRSKLVQEMENASNQDETNDDDKQRGKLLAALKQKYTIQEVLKKGQILLVQVSKDSRGNKGPSLSTYISLPGKYSVLMPNSFSQGGISRKISDPSIRKNFKAIKLQLNIPKEMAIILRTAGYNQPFSVIENDYQYVTSLWSKIRTNTLESFAPSLIHKESSPLLIAIRDYLDDDIKKIYIEGDKIFEEAQSLLEILYPKKKKNVIHYKEDVSLFNHFHLEKQIAALAMPVVSLPSGGYIVVQQTEALVSIDVNSGKATQQRHINNTALSINLEAAKSVAKHVKLQNLSGLIVVDFIDMNDQDSITQVEQAMRKLVSSDKARIQVGKISQFGLMELSRQRLQPSLFEFFTKLCPICQGSGIVMNKDLTASSAMRTLEELMKSSKENTLPIRIHQELMLTLVNTFFSSIAALEKTYNTSIEWIIDNTLASTDFSLTGKYSIPKTPKIIEKNKGRKNTFYKNKKPVQKVAHKPSANKPSVASSSVIGRLKKWFKTT